MTTQASTAEREQVLRLELVKAGRELDRRGWAMGTSGNLSARLDGPDFVITASGRQNGWGWIYGVGDGLLHDLGVSVTGESELAARYAAACAAVNAEAPVAPD